MPGCGDVLGIVSVLVNDVPPLPEDPRSREGYIINEYVKPAARSRGVGRASSCEQPSKC